jgi:5-methylcytosine-specific restriction endonuclease McrA
LTTSTTSLQSTWTCPDCGSEQERSSPERPACGACGYQSGTKRSVRLDNLTCADCGETWQRPVRTGPKPPRCIPCRSVHDRTLDKIRYDANPEKRRAMRKRIYDADPEKARAAVRAWREAHPEQVRAYWKRWYTSDLTRHRENNRQLTAKWRAANPEQALASVYKWQAANRDSVRATARRAEYRRRVRELAATAGPNTLTAAEWAATLDLFAGTCAYCYRPAEAQDHVVPVSKGGEHTADNVVPACTRCNSRKSNSSLLEWAARGVVA